MKDLGSKVINNSNTFIVINKHIAIVNTIILI